VCLRDSTASSGHRTVSIVRTPRSHSPSLDRAKRRKRLDRGLRAFGRGWARSARLAQNLYPRGHPQTANPYPCGSTSCDCCGKDPFGPLDLQPKGSDSRRFRCQNREAETSGARLDRLGLGDHTLLVFTVWWRGGAHQFAGGSCTGSSPASFPRPHYLASHDGLGYHGIG
jgi:hypothetical protein